MPTLKIYLFFQQPINAGDENFWDQFWSENVLNIQDVFTLIPSPEIRSLKEEAPANLATLCNKAIEKMVRAVDNSCRTQQEQQAGILLKCKITCTEILNPRCIFFCIVLNCCRLLTRLLPYIFEDPDWQAYFWSTVKLRSEDDVKPIPLAQLLLNAICVSIFILVLNL